MSAPTFKIERGIPIPTPRGRALYPFEKLKVGDSFFVPNRTPHSMHGSVRYAQVKRGIKLLMRTEGNGTRIWRVKK